MSYSLAKRSATSLRAADSIAVLAAQAFQNDPDLLLGRIMLARRPSDVRDNLLSWFLQWSGLLRSYER